MPVHWEEESNPKSFLIIAIINHKEIIYGFEDREKRKVFLDKLHEICGEKRIDFTYKLQETDY